MLQEEVIDIVSEELIEFLEGYIAMTSLTHEAFTMQYEHQKSMRFGRYTDYFYRNGEQHFTTKHSISKIGRTKMRFGFSFYKDELYYAMQLIRLLDGYIDYSMYNGSDGYSYYFTLDVGSKARCIELFDKLNVLREWME